jgi:hypothetical protein
VHTSSGAHPASYSMFTGKALWPGLKWPVGEADHSPPPCAKVTNKCSYASYSPHFFMTCKEKTLYYLPHTGHSSIPHFFHFYARSENCGKLLLASSCLAVRMKKPDPPVRMFMKFDTECFSKICRENSSFI